MIEELRIRALGVIDESVLELGAGFTAITGETGAGKTMLVSALGLLMGGRADSGAVRRGSGRAQVEGLLSLERLPSVSDLVLEAGGVVEEDRLLLVRQVSAEGRSRAFAGGAGVPAATLAQLADALVAVHGQSDQHRLLRADAQRDALDRFAGDEAASLRSRFAADYEELRITEATLAEVRASTRERAREADVLRFGMEEVERVAPRAGEEDELAAEEGRLGFADTLRTAAEQAREALSAEEGGPDALGAVAAARGVLASVRSHDAQAGDLADRLAELGYLLADLAADVSSYAAGLETDPQRLAAVSERRAALTALTRKYGETIEEVLAWSAHAAERLLLLEDTDGLVDRLAQRREEVLARLSDSGARLTRIRVEAAGALGEAVTRELHALAMPQALLTVAVAQTEAPEGSSGVEVAGRRVRMSSSGLDDVEFLLAANPGATPRPLGRGASGGELSRVMLALEVVLAGTASVPTLVFDEVDAGVGGAAAVEVGRRLAALARGAQVVAVTHLPQVAAFADRHVVVTKAADGRVTTAGLTLLDEEGRVRELSRMLAGLEDSQTARAHARELLTTARAGVAAKDRAASVPR